MPVTCRPRARRNRPARSAPRGNNPLLCPGVRLLPGRRLPILRPKPRGPGPGIFQPSRGSLTFPARTGLRLPPLSGLPLRRRAFSSRLRSRNRRALFSGSSRATAPPGLARKLSPPRGGTAPRAPRESPPPAETIPPETGNEKARLPKHSEPGWKPMFLCRGNDLADRWPDKRPAKGATAEDYSLFCEMTCLARVASGALGNLRVSSVRRCLAAAFLLS